MLKASAVAFLSVAVVLLSALNRQCSVCAQAEIHGENIAQEETPTRKCDSDEGSECNFRLASTHSASNRSSEYIETDERSLDELMSSRSFDIENTFKLCMNAAKERSDFEKTLIARGRYISSKVKYSDISLLRRKNTDPMIHKYESAHLPFEKATEMLINNYKLSDNEIKNVLPKMKLDGPYSKPIRETCSTATPVLFCNPNSKYRTMTGHCNNYQHPKWGSSGSCLNRMVGSYYIGYSGFRQSWFGGPLPNPRVLSLNIHSHLNSPTNYVTHMYMFFGQLLDHDIAMAPISTLENNEAIQCCPGTAVNHPQCAPIRLPPNDPFYAQYGIQCINFVRSAICPTCTLGTREQMNQVSAFIDASFLYGNDNNEVRQLRTNDGTGRLRVQRNRYGDLLPPSPDPLNDQCSFPATREICFQAGDPRANQHPPLASLHTVFLREHNRIADYLRQINPRWNGDTIFEEARRIVGAQMQVITYKEFLPITLGRDRMNYFRLWIGNKGNTAYDPQVNPMILSEFSTAAFRFGHSLINGMISRPAAFPGYANMLLRDTFFRPFGLYSGLLDPLLSGVSYSPAQWFDRHMVPDVTQYLYRTRGNLTGLDLAAINTQRGRDHGIPPYVEMVRFCSDGKIIIKNFNDLVNYAVMPVINAQLLGRNYRHVNDVDLWTGILSETPKEGAVVGPTGACIIGLQFKKLKFGDRFYFEHWDQKGSFTYPQLQELRKTSLSKIICANTRIAQMPLNAMIFNSVNNPLINCRQVRGIDLSLWKE